VLDEHLSLHMPVVDPAKHSPLLQSPAYVQGSPMLRGAAPVVHEVQSQYCSEPSDV
jgi:hypothetical protein